MQTNTNDGGPFPYFPTAWHLDFEGVFQVHEFREMDRGPSITDAFTMRLRDFIVSIELQNTVALISKPDRATIELTHSSGSGTIAIPLSDASKCGINTENAVTTGWAFEVGPTGIIELKGEIVCAPKKGGNHQVVIGSKPLPKLG